jgi:O-antigen/teichoic acid export membrane protein
MLASPVSSSPGPPGNSRHAGFAFAYLFNLDYLRNLFQFVGWKMLGISCVVLRGQGAPVLINLKFGPLVNAGYSIAYRLSIQATSLSEALTGAFQPALTSSEGKGDRNDMLAMAMQVCKFGALLVVLFVLPLTLEMDTVMKLWLGSPPDYAGPLCQWMLAMLLLDKLTAGPMLAVNAVGNIAAYELVQGSLYLLALPLMLLLFAAGIGPVAVGAALFASNAAYCAGRLLFSRRLAGFPVGRWFRTVALPFAFLTLLGVTAGWSVMQVFPPGFSRICLTTGITSLITMATGWFWLLDHKERRFVKNLLCKISTRLSPLGAASADIPAPRANHPNFPPE